VDGLSESAIVAIQPTGFEGAVICCAYVGRDRPAGHAQFPAQKLGKALPPYMLPSRWAVMDALQGLPAARSIDADCG